MLVVKVDVIIAVYNAESTIEECVRSAAHQVVPDKLIREALFISDEKILNRKRKHHSSSDANSKELSSVDIHFDVCICCYNDASTDESLKILNSLDKEECLWKDYVTSSEDDQSPSYHATMKTKLLIGSAPIGTSSRGAGYARNQAVKLRDNYEEEEKSVSKNGTPKKSPLQEEDVTAAAHHYLCILDSDDIMHPTRIAEQTCAMLSINTEVRDRTLMGCNFDRIPKDSTHHYSQWANSLSDHRLYWEQFRECTLLQPTWFLPKTWFEHLGRYVEAPVSDDTIKQQKCTEDEDVSTEDCDAPTQYYRLVHPSEVTNPSIGSSNDSKAHVNSTLRLAEDTRLFYAHLHAGGKLYLHRTQTPLVTYRHRSGMSQSSSTPRKLLLRLRAKAWEDIIYHANKSIWTNGFAIWGCGRDGKDFLKALSPEVVSKVICFVDVDKKKIETVKWYDNPALLGSRRIPILHFSVLSKHNVSEKEESFGHINKRTSGGEDIFNIVSKQDAQEPDNTHEVVSNERKGQTKKKEKKAAQSSIDPKNLKHLPVVVCVAMYRTNGALESNVSSIGRVEGHDFWHII